MSDYPYPPDEFDEYEIRSAPVGVHRAPRSKWSRIWPFFLVIALCATVAVVGIWLLARPHTPIIPEDPLIAAELQPEEADPEPTTPEGYDPYPDGEEPQYDPDGYEVGSLEALLAAADLAASVRVLNDTAPGGEAGRGASALSDAGFTTTTAGNYPGDSGLTATSVWYTDGYRDTALAVAKVLGIPDDRVIENTTTQGVINVILRGALQLP